MRDKAKNRFFNFASILFLAIFLSNIAVAQRKITKPVESDKTSKENVFLKVELNGNDFKVGEPVKLTLTIKNYTNSTIFIFDAVPERGFDIAVKDSSGLNLSLTENGKKKKYPDIVMGRAGAYVKAGEKLKLRTVELNDLFDLNQVGKHILEVKVIYYVQDVEEDGKTLSSGKVEFRLTR